MKQLRLVCTADPRDVLSVKSKEGKDLVSELLAVLQNAAAPAQGQVESRSFNAVTLLFPGTLLPDKGRLEEAVEKLCAAFGVKRAHLSFAQEEAKEAPKTASPAGEAPPAKEEAPQENAGAYDHILSLVGVEEIKAWAEHLHAMNGEGADPAARVAALTGMSYLLAVNPGNGCTTVLDAMGRMLAEKLGRQDFSLREVTLEYREDRDALRGVAEEVASVKRGDKLVLFAFHIDAYLTRLRSDAFVSFLQEIRKGARRAVFVFVTPFLESSVLRRIREDLEDTVSCRILRIRPYSDRDLICFFERYFSEQKMEVDLSCHDLLLKKVAAEKSDGRFYGVNTVQKICDEILYEKFMSGNGSSPVTSDDVAAVLPGEGDGEELSGQEQLDRLVALEQVKEKVREMCAMIRFEKKRGKDRPRSMHMAFSGAPGTGKTAVARILGRILREEGVLAKGDFYEVSRKDLVGRFVGHTAPKTAEVCRTAYDSILFLDEAYALADGSENDFGKEAVSTLIAEMENHRDRLIVIFAGYEEELQKLFDLNPGLRDRVPYHIHFSNYSREELRDIFFLQLPKDFRYEDAFRDRVGRYFAELPEKVLKDERFSNARFVRNVAERVVSKAALRLYLAEDLSPQPLLLESDFDLAVADAEFRELMEQKKSGAIGF